jgi:hypothetical protein
MRARTPIPRAVFFASVGDPLAATRLFLTGYNANTQTINTADNMEI